MTVLSASASGVCLDLSESLTGLATMPSNPGTL